MKMNYYHERGYLDYYCFIAWNSNSVYLFMFVRVYFHGLLVVYF